ncbi:MAG: pyridoxal phosphate-dependent aminotransferase [Polyangia bacterium]|jgi:aspartate aminotransferase|nr:pyridoxal phosphate-dependent aminotransferase [Polyangia bacterium]
MSISSQIGSTMQRSSWIRRMFDQGIELKQKYGETNVFDFTLGNPSMEPPREFKEALIAAATDPRPGLHRYMPNAGLPEVRSAIAESVSREHGIHLTARHVVMTTGAACALNVALKALLDSGDEVITLAPYFVEYLFYVPNHGGVNRIAETRSDFGLDLEAIAEALGPRTKALILNSPNNPTGVIYPEEDLKRLNDLLAGHERNTGRPVYVIHDDPYRRLIYDGHKEASSLKIFDHGIFCTSHAKDISIPGERIGYLAVRPDAADADALMDACAFTIRVLGFVNAPALMQRVVAGIQHVTVDVEVYRRKRDLLLDALLEIGYRCVRPQGAFYLFPESPIPDDVAFTRSLMEHRVMAVPGSGFGRQGHFRLAYCVEDSTIQGSLAGFKAAFDQAQRLTQS